MSEKYKVTGEMEDEIFRVSNFVKELSRVQDKYFEQLVKFMNERSESELDERTKDFLFDYIFNEYDSKETFEEYLVRFNQNK